MILTKNIKRKLYEYLRKKLGMYDYRKGWLKGDCPYCGEHKFGVNLAINRTNCFKCGNHPQPLDVVMEIEGLFTRNETIIALNAFDGMDFYEEAVEIHQQKTDVVLPDGYKNIKRGKSVLGKTVRKYVKRRGFDIDELAKAGWGYVDKPGKYFGYLIMPFYKQGRIVYFNARLFIGSGPKFNNPLIEDFGLGKSMLIYNIDALTLYNRIFVVESVMNARTLGDSAIGMGGKKLSNYQLNIIIKSPCKKVVIGLDDDAIEDAIIFALKLVPFKKVKIMQFPEGKDINDLGKDKSMAIVHKAKYLSYNELLQLKFAVA